MLPAYSRFSHNYCKVKTWLYMLYQRGGWWPFLRLYKSRAVTKWVFKNKTLCNDIENLLKYKDFFLDPMRVYRYKNMFTNLSLLDTLNKRVLTSVMLQSHEY